MHGLGSPDPANKVSESIPLSYELSLITTFDELGVDFVRREAGQSVLAVVHDLETNDYAIAASPDYLQQPDFSPNLVYPNDPLFSVPMAFGQLGQRRPKGSIRKARGSEPDAEHCLRQRRGHL